MYFLDKGERNHTFWVSLGFDKNTKPYIGSQTNMIFELSLFFGFFLYTFPVIGDVFKDVFC